MTVCCILQTKLDFRTDSQVTRLAEQQSTRIDKGVLNQIMLHSNIAALFRFAHLLSVYVSGASLVFQG